MRNVRQLHGPGLNARKQAEFKMAACEGKARFESAVLAHEVLRRRNRQRNKEKGSAYHCKLCGGWHLGRGK